MDGMGLAALGQCSIGAGASGGSAGKFAGKSAGQSV